VATRAAEQSLEQADDKRPSGRLLLRMPRTLHAELAQLAERRGVSLNHLIVGLLAGSVSNGDGAPSATPATASPDARVQKRLSIALTVNLVVLVLVGAVAIALLVVALSGGF
jgi:HicB family